MARGRFKKKHEEGIAGSELNLVPYLDIMMNIIMFMLLTYQVVAELRLIQYNPPAVAKTTNLGGSTNNDPDKPKIMLTVMVLKEGYQIVTTDENYGSQTIPMTPKKEWDYAELTRQLVVLKAMPNLDEHLIVVAESDIVYDTVVKTLDAARTDTSGKNLFPNVTLAMASDK